MRQECCNRKVCQAREHEGVVYPMQHWENPVGNFVTSVSGMAARLLRLTGFIRRQRHVTPASRPR
jgi:hypothetical protein